MGPKVIRAPTTVLKPAADHSHLTLKSCSRSSTKLRTANSAKMSLWPVVKSVSRTHATHRTCAGGPPQGPGFEGRRRAGTSRNARFKGRGFFRPPSAHASPKAASHAAPLAVDSSVNALQVQVVTDLVPADVSPADQNDAGTRMAALPVLRRGGDVNAVDTLARLVRAGTNDNNSPQYPRKSTPVRTRSFRWSAWRTAIRT